MKKALTAALLAAITISSVPMEAMGQYSMPTKEQAIQKLNQSWARLQQCLTLQCTKWEALKAGRDASLAIAAVIVALYGLGAVTKKVAHKAESYPLLKVGRGMQAPGKAVMGIPGAIERGVRHIPGFKFRRGDTVYFTNPEHLQEVVPKIMRRYVSLSSPLKVKKIDGNELTLSSTAYPYVDIKKAHSMYLTRTAPQ